MAARIRHVREVLAVALFFVGAGPLVLARGHKPATGILFLCPGIVFVVRIRLVTISGLLLEGVDPKVCDTRTDGRPRSCVLFSFARGPHRRRLILRVVLGAFCFRAPFAASELPSDFPARIPFRRDRAVLARRRSRTRRTSREPACSQTTATRPRCLHMDLVRPLLLRMGLDRYGRTICSEGPDRGAGRG